VENTNYIVSSSPHIRSGESTNLIMRDVIIALIPALISGIYFFGFKALTITALAVITCIATEMAMQKLLGREVTVKDLSAAVTGMLLAFNMPASSPWWMVIIGSIFAIAIVKQLFGGLGHNFINPALAARAVLLASWPVRMTTWPIPGAVDAATGATPLAMLKEGINYINGLPVAAGGEMAGQALPNIWNLFIGNVGGCIGETSVLALAIGGAYLLYRGVINIRVPAIYILTVGVLAFAFGKFDINYFVYHVFAGGLFLGAIFMATDYSTTPMTVKGQVVMGVGCGLLTFVIRFWGGYPEGVSYSILLMNVATPLIDRFTMPRKFGEVKKSA